MILIMLFLNKTLYFVTKNVSSSSKDLEVEISTFFITLPISKLGFNLNITKLSILNSCPLQ